MSATAGDAAASQAGRRFAPRPQCPTCPTRRGCEERPTADSRRRASCPLAAEPLAMPTHDGVRVHDEQGCAPILPRVGEQHPKQSISVAELGTPHGALERGQRLTECQILERDGSVSTADQRGDRSATTSAASMSYPVSRSATGSTGAGDLILANDSKP